MAEGMAIVGLASSIITFLTVSYEVYTRAREFSRTAGQLPTDIESAKDLLDVITRSAERLSARVGTSSAAINPVLGLPTEQEVALVGLFDKLTALSADLLRVIDKLDIAGCAISKALISIRKEKRVENIRSELNRCIISINFLLSEGLHASVGDVTYVIPFPRNLTWHRNCRHNKLLPLPHDLFFRPTIRKQTRDIAFELKKQHLELHQRLEQKMSAGFQTLSDSVNGSHDKLLHEFKKLMANQEDIVTASHLDLLLGQHDISQNLNAMTRLIAIAKSDIKQELVKDMERTLLEQSNITRTALQLTAQEANSSMVVQIQALLYQMLDSSPQSAHSRSIAGIPGEYALTDISQQPENKENGIYLRVDFEFRFHSDVLAFHVKNCIEWAASTLFRFPSFHFSIPSFMAKNKKEMTEYSSNTQSTLHDKFEIEIIFRRRRGEYHRIRLLLPDEAHKGDLSTAIRFLFTKLQFKLGLIAIQRLSYVRYNVYPNVFQCFQVERSNPPRISSIEYAFFPTMYLLYMVKLARYTYSKPNNLISPKENYQRQDDRKLLEIFLTNSKLLNKSVCLDNKITTRVVETDDSVAILFRICEYLILAVAFIIILIYPQGIIRMIKANIYSGIYCIFGSFLNLSLVLLAQYLQCFPVVEIEIKHFTGSRDQSTKMQKSFKWVPSLNPYGMTIYKRVPI